MKFNKVFCLFEQSGTFRDAFKRLGYPAFDYDIDNAFNTTDFQLNLFDEIQAAYLGNMSIFDFIKPGDLIISFFPCVRFTDKALLLFNCDGYSLRAWSDSQKVDYAYKLHCELHNYYSYLCKLFMVCYERNLRLIVENPYSTQHYLIKYFPIKPDLIILNRRLYGDYFVKPTQFFTVNCSLNKNYISLPFNDNEYKQVEVERGINRSLISPEFATDFIKRFILDD